MVGVVRCADSIEVELLHELYILQTGDLAHSHDSTTALVPAHACCSQIKGRAVRALALLCNW
jgi:hypothetical protein